MGAKTEKAPLELREQVFGCPFNAPLVHQAVVSYQAGGRSGSRAQKSRAEVRGGGRKPWRQKKMGRARAGSIRSPLWRGGGVTFAARPQSHARKMNRKMYRGALRAILSERMRREEIVVVPELQLAEPKTRLLAQQLREYGLSDVLIVLDGIDDTLRLAARNLPHMALQEMRLLNPVSLLSHEKILFTEAALRKVEEWLA